MLVINYHIFELSLACANAQTSQSLRCSWSNMDMVWTYMMTQTNTHTSGLAGYVGMVVYRGVCASVISTKL